MGAALFEATLKTCKELKLNGMCWQVLDWNTPAINFYHKYDAEISSAWLNGKLTKQQIDTLALILNTLFCKLYKIFFMKTLYPLLIAVLISLLLLHSLQAT